jgi:hypothetical protein
VTASTSVGEPVEPPVNVAPTVFEESNVTVQPVRVPLHAPDQPVNVEPEAGVAESATVTPCAGRSVQAVAPFPQLMPPPLTVPRPVTDTVSVGAVVGALENVAPTVFADVIETMHVDVVSVHAPDQPVKVAPEAGVAVNVTSPSTASFAVHVVPPLPQLMPPPLTRPGPVTLTVSCAVLATNFAATLFDSFMTTTQLVAVPPHAPLQPPNAAPLSGTAERVIDEPIGSLALHVTPLLPQLI